MSAYEEQISQYLRKADEKGILKKIEISGAGAPTEHGWQLTKNFWIYTEGTCFPGPLYSRPSPPPE